MVGAAVGSLKLFPGFTDATDALGLILAVFLVA